MARLLGLQLDPSGGAAVEALAREGDDQRFRFSRPLLRKPNCNFSYAGLKTAVRLAIDAELKGPPSEANRQVRRNGEKACVHKLHCCLRLDAACRVLCIVSSRIEVLLLVARIVRIPRYVQGPNGVPSGAQYLGAS